MCFNNTPLIPACLIAMTKGEVALPLPLSRSIEQMVQKYISNFNRPSALTRIIVRNEESDQKQGDDVEQRL